MDISLEINIIPLYSSDLKTWYDLKLYDVMLGISVGC